MASLGDSASMFGDPRASQFSTMRHNQRVFSDPAIANHSNHATSSHIKGKTFSFRHLNSLNNFLEIQILPKNLNK